MTSNSGKTVRTNRSARVRAYEHLSQGILRGDLPEGTYLDESQVALSLGLSRTPVREALRQLSSEKYVSLVPRRGAQVRFISIQEMEELYEARFLIEATAVKKICERKLQLPDNIIELIPMMEKQAQEADWFSFALTDHLFHSGIVHLYDNSVLGELYDFLRPRQIRLAVRALERSTERVVQFHQEHNDLIDAIEKSDSESAINTLSMHLMSNPSVASVPE